ncbi:EpsG family protein [uncultured Clostridium sp.]|uniref:EpsG family protein n=1 Tax=uncultured Clostridium sp. TaxID=59620 RepID=UPI0025CFA4AC|nr:EpsG family protein [uncultured Clostridium sp.]
MQVYFIILLLIILSYFVLPRRLYLTFTLCIISFIFCCRNIHLGLGDVDGTYYVQFINLTKTSWLEILNQYSIKNGIAFACISKLFSSVGLSYQFFIATLYAFFMFVSGKIIKEFSNNYLLSVVILYTCSCIYAASIIRQYLSISFILLMVLYYYKKSYIKSFIMFVFAFFVHFSAVVFLPTIMLLIYEKKRKKLNLVLPLLFIILGFIFSNFGKIIILNVIKVLNHQMYQYIYDGIYSFGNDVSLIWFMILFVSVFLYFLLNGLSFENIYSHIYLNIKKRGYLTNDDSINYDMYFFVSIGIACYLLSNIVAEFYRVSQYFSIFNMILLPNMICQIRYHKNREIVTVLCIILFFIYMLMSPVKNLNFSKFLFFWG